MTKPKGETDLCRARLIKYCQGQGIDLGCGVTKIKVDAIGLDLYHPEADMRKDARVMDFYPDKHFDYVYSSHLLEEIENTEATLREWLRILKDGGYLVLYQADKDLYYPMGDPKCNPVHKHHFGWEDLWAILEKIGGVELVHHARHPEEPHGEWSFELVVKKMGSIEKLTIPELIHFKIMVVGGPAEKYIDKCLSSIAEQNYKNWSCQVILDPVGDKTYENSLKNQSEKIKIQLNETRQYNVANFLTASKLLQPADNDVLVMIDADDWLSSPESLSIEASYYAKNPNLLVTHGSWEAYPVPNVTNNIPYSVQDFKNGIRAVPWRGSHLRTCKYKIWKLIKDEDLRDSDGKYFTVTGDLALMFPMLEMAGYERVKFIPEILYVYNQETDFTDEKLRHGTQLSIETYLRGRPPYEILTEIKEIIAQSPKELNTIIFSKNRACQLDALLRSIDYHWKDWKRSTKITVIWTYKEEKYLEGYKKLIVEHPEINFINQKDKDFKSTLISTIDPTSLYSMFLVDDMMFINSFSLDLPEVKAFKNNPEALCLSLRMHPNIRYCYMLSIPLIPPEFSNGAWKWKGLPGDWGYVKSVDSHLFRTNDIIQAITNEHYTHPNDLEEALIRGIQDKPYAYCFQQSKTVNIPSNSVGNNMTNRRGNISEDFLNDQYLKGLKINITPFTGMLTKSCHMELEYSWV
jgi:predicted SAM-dependent methyltransferase/glycosyltransferase involved in cell wall biosynthesis